METELWSGDTKAIIALDGAWVTNLSDENGDILYPKRTLKNQKGEVKERGGCHVCLPNFGPDGQSGLARHGFGRELLWQKETSSTNSVRLRLVVGEGAYAGLDAAIVYTLEDRRFIVELVVENTSENELALAPGFHPYFTAHGEAITLNGEKYDLAQLNEAQFTNADTMTLITDARHLHLHSTTLRSWALWTDQLGPYVCVEPTWSGFAFLETDRMPDMVAPSEKRSYGFLLEWRLPSDAANA